MTEASRVQKLLSIQNTEIDALKNRVAELEEENRQLRLTLTLTQKPYAGGNHENNRGRHQNPR